MRAKVEWLGRRLGILLGVMASMAMLSLLLPIIVLACFAYVIGEMKGE